MEGHVHEISVIDKQRPHATHAGSPLRRGRHCGNGYRSRSLARRRLAPPLRATATATATATTTATPTHTPKTIPTPPALVTASTWTLGSLPPPIVTGATSQISAVTCATTSFCVAVGSETAPVVGVDALGLVEQWNGSAWSIAKVLAPARPLPG